MLHDEQVIIDPVIFNQSWFQDVSPYHHYKSSPWDTRKLYPGVAMIHLLDLREIVMIIFYCHYYVDTLFTVQEVAPRHLILHPLGTAWMIAFGRIFCYHRSFPQIDEFMNNSVDGQTIESFYDTIQYKTASHLNITLSGHIDGILPKGP